MPNSPHLPALADAQKLAAGHKLVPVYRRLLSDSLTPVSAFHLLDQGGYASLFESVIGGEKVGRYTFVAMDPFLSLTARGNQVTVKSEQGEETLTIDDPLVELRRRLAEFPAAHLPELPPFTGGAIGYCAYDVVRYVEKLKNPPKDDRGLPDLCFGLVDRMLVFDNVNKTLYVIAMARLDKFADFETAYADAQRRVDEWVEKLTQAAALPPVDIQRSNKLSLSFKSNTTSSAYQDAVKKCVEYIRAGDIFQVVLSQRLQLELNCDPFEVYRTLRVVNPSPFMFFLRTPETTLVGSSPEVMCRVQDGIVTVRPLAGTRKRGETDEEDRRLADELMKDPKERAEHVMLVDLGRNDVGRVARFGSVKLSDVMVIERYSHVMHITSNVTGELRPELDAFDAMKACLPAGTVSGAPKVRAMEIIDELEPHRRGPYAGAVGYIDYAGNMDTCIALRTLVVQGNQAYVQAGAGIVADSDPESEYQETLNKARGLLLAIEMTQQRAAR
ncbi:anthranilate synthase component I [Anatilimnocola floriformis]|uniref:anthranilate synthase component I n=1 Tax=Anatilimnocola floriformis TaxID=2948575 RepID=UPI0020C33B56|nr:anthranilate synthase component I [Anatilimnocola floriformis]